VAVRGSDDDVSGVGGEAGLFLVLCVRACVHVSCPHVWVLACAPPMLFRFWVSGFRV
jgi:hypothetical protein